MRLGAAYCAAALLVGLQDWTDQRLDRIEGKMDSKCERIAQIEGLLAGLKLRPDAPASASAGD